MSSLQIAIRMAIGHISLYPSRYKMNLIYSTVMLHQKADSSNTIECINLIFRSFCMRLARKP